MEKNYILEELIHKGAAVVCYSAEDVIKLSEWVDVLCPGVGSRIRCYKNAVGSKEYGGEIAIRLEKWHDTIDYGWDRPSYYEKRGFTLVNILELQCDFGEFETNDVGMNGLLFGGV